MGDRSLRRDDGSGNGCGWLAHHSHARPSDGEIAAGARICRGDKRRDDHSSRELLRHSSFHHPRDLDFHYGRRRGETFQRDEMDRGGAHHLDLAFHSARKRPYRLRARARRGGALSFICSGGPGPLCFI